MLKVCGATTREEVDLLAAVGADPWGFHGVPGGPADLSVTKLAALAAVARASEGIEPVVVTFLSDANTLAGPARRGRWVQLHAYQPPGVVRGRSRPPCRVQPWRRSSTSGATPASRNASSVPTNAPGPTAPARRRHRGRSGRQHRPTTSRKAVARLADRLTRPFLLAGGIADEFRSDDKVVVEHPLFLGVDVDSGARGADGRFDPDAAAIRACWRAPVDAGPVDDGFVDAENVA